MRVSRATQAALKMNTMDTQSPHSAIAAATQWLSERIIGQEALIDRLMMTLLCGGHLLVEGAPGLAKTRAIKELSELIEGDFHRIQFTPDLLPSDVTGTEIYRPEDGSFNFQRGPIFHNMILADEINRAPAKVQSALLEAMAEHQVSVGRETFALPKLFLVMATQNPIEQEGTYPLPEAQLDRFLMHVMVDYPDRDAEERILHLVRDEARNTPSTPPRKLTQLDIFNARQDLLSLHMAEPVERYLIELVMASRNPHGELQQWLDYGSSPRGTIGIDICARARAWIDGRDFVTPEDIQSVAHDVLRHRLILSFEADAQGISTDQVIDLLVQNVPVP
jgi:MoxR-like ATPase